MTSNVIKKSIDVATKMSKKNMARFIAMMMVHSLSFAAVEIPFVEDFACSIVQFLTGPMAAVIFVVVVVVTLVFGMIAKVKWEVIITVCIIFGVILGLGSLLGETGISGLDSCFPG